METTNLLIGLASIVVLGIVAQWIAWRFVLPSILLLLVFGFLAGPVFGFLDPDALLGPVLFPIVSVSVAIILFEGGLTLRFSELREVGKVVRNLVTVGALVTWVTAAFAAIFVFDVNPAVGILFGAILTVSGPTVVMPLLRHVRPSRRVGSILKWEGIVIDPIGALLAVLVFEAIRAGGFLEGTMHTIEGALLTILVGTGIGLLAAAIVAVLLMKYWVPDFLHNPVALMIVVAAFAASDMVQHESGLFAVTVMGIALANQKRVDLKHILEFKENLRVLLLSGIFILLAARLELETVLAYIDLDLLLFLALLVLVIRPLGVFVSSLGSPLSWRERTFLGWMAPRGIVAAAVSAIFGLSLAQAGVADAEQLAPLTFLVIVGTVLIYGLTAAPVARLLGVAMPSAQGVLVVGAHRWGRRIAKALMDAGLRVLVVDTNMGNISAAKNAGLFASQGSVLSEWILDKIELEGIGRMIALTSNDEVNALAALHFTERFGRSEVYQLQPEKGARQSAHDVPVTLRGRVLFDPDATYTFFEELFEHGAAVETIEITESTSYDDFMAENAGEVIPLFVVDEVAALIPFTAREAPDPVAGQKLIYVRSSDHDAVARATDYVVTDNPDEEEVVPADIEE